MLETPTPRRRNPWPVLLGALVLAAILGWTGFTMLQTSASVSALPPSVAKVGQLAPEIKVHALENGNSGRAVSLSALRGKPVVINFWATWCNPCRAEFPAFEAKYREYKDTKGLVIVGIDAQGDTGPGGAQQFISQMGATYPIWLDEDASAEDTYRVDALPTTVFIDRQGFIRDILVGGPLSTNTLEKELQKIF